MFNNSVCEYKNRLTYGNHAYRGNTSGGIVRDFLDFAHKNPTGLFVDPMAGGGTSADVAKENGLRYKGFDLKSGFNIVRDDLGQRLGEMAESIFCHPPYWKMIQYSDHPDDLSNGSLEEFLSKLQLAMMNVYDALRPGGMYGVLMGNYRSAGTYYPLCSLTLTVCPGKLREEIIKVQNNCTSDRQKYAGVGKTFIPIKHETMYIFQKETVTKVLLDFALDFSRLLQQTQQMTWMNIIQRVFQKNHRELTLEEIYNLVQRNAANRTKSNPHWKAKVRQVVQNDKLFTRIQRGRYKLKD